jgi:hypothetical protein
VRPDRDDPLAPAIRRTLQGSRTDCPDADTIGAYAERSLAGAERRAVELHLSTCARCRETLLLMSRAAEADTPASPSPRFLLYRWPWLAGAAAAGLAIVVWLALPPSAVQAPETDSIPQVAAREVGKAQAPVESEQSAGNKAPVESDRASAKAAPSAVPSPAARVGSTQSQARERQAFGEEKRLADRRDERKLEEAGERRARVQTPPAAQEAPPPHAAVPPPAARSAEEQAAPARKPDSSARDTASPQLMARARQNLEYLITSGPPANAQAASAIPALTWRVWASGLVERSTDGGGTWTREPGLDAPAARAILAPSREVCWIVGDHGLILRYDAGRGWARLSPPAQIGFIAVEASDALHATISATDGQRFTTTDGGRTWR